MFHFISYAANPINKTEDQQFKPKLVTKQTPSTNRRSTVQTETSYETNPINKTEGQQFKPKLVTKQTPSTEPKVNSFNKSRYVYTGSIQCLRWPLTVYFPSGPLRAKMGCGRSDRSSKASTGFTSFEKVHTHTCTLRHQFWETPTDRKQGPIHLNPLTDSLIRLRYAIGFTKPQHQIIEMIVGNQNGFVGRPNFDTLPLLPFARSSFFLAFSTSLSAFHLARNLSASATSSVMITLSKMVLPFTCSSACQKHTRRSLNWPMHLYC